MLIFVPSKALSLRIETSAWRKNWIHHVLAPIFRPNPALGNTYTCYRFLRSNPSFLQMPDQCSLDFRFNGNQLMERGEFEPHETQYG